MGCPKRRGGSNLDDWTAIWPTPRAGDSDKWSAGKQRKHSLTQQAKIWPTPSATDAQGRGYTRDCGEKGRERPALLGMARYLSSLLDLLTTLHGSAPSNSTPRLSPRFVEWLMGWPLGWTDCGCSATEWFRWKRRMRIALSRLPCPMEMERQSDQLRLF